MTKDEYITQEIQAWLKVKKPKTTIILANDIAVKVKQKFQDASYLFRQTEIATLDFKCYIDDRIKQIRNNMVGMF
jgi:hypothetical protein